MTFSDRDTNKLIERAQNLAKEAGRRHICEDILFASFFPVFNLSVALIIDGLGISEEILKEDSHNVVKLLKRHKKPSNKFSKEVLLLLQNAEKMAKEQGEELMLYHIFVCFSDCLPFVLRNLGVTKEMLELAHKGFETGFSSEEETVTEISGRLPMFDSHPILSRFAENLNLQAADGVFDEIVDFDNKIDEMITILCKKQKPNPILVGGAGVGKTSLVQALALRIVRQQVPDLLADKVIYSLSLSSMVAGTEYRGQFEKRMKELVTELKKYDNVIVFIDEIHTLVGAGNSQENTLDASNILKPDLARGTISCIGATTIKEYNSTIRRDAALDRRFEKVLVREPSAHDMEKILPIILSQYETVHRVIFTEAFKSAVLPMCDSFLPNRKYPDKAVDVIDSCGAKAKVSHYDLSSKTKGIKEKLLLEVEDKGVSADSIKEFCSGVLALQQELEINVPQIGEEELRSFFARYKSPIFRFCEDPVSQRKLRKEIVGQHKAFNIFIKALDSNLLGADVTRSGKTPLSFLVYGPDGSGKTLFCDSVAEALRREGVNIIRFSGMELSGYAARYKILSEVKDEGSLAEQVMLNPTSFIFIDGFDDCDSDVRGLIQQILSQGKLSAGSGEVVDFANCQIVLTCDSEEKGISMGFVKDADADGITPKIKLNSLCFNVPLEKPNKKTFRRVLYNYLVKLNKSLREKSGVEVVYDLKFLSKFAEKAEKEKKTYISDVLSGKIPDYVVSEIRKGRKQIDLSDLLK